MEGKTHEKGMHIEPASSGSNGSTLSTLFVELLAHRASAA
jgi:hypothetical protein